MSPHARLASRALAWAALVLGALVLLIVVLNAFDRPLAPATKALLTPPPNPFAAADNAYLWMLGFDAPPGTAVVEAGEARVAERDRRQQPLLGDRRAVAGAAAPDPQRLRFVGPDDFCRDALSTVWEQYATRGPEVARLLADNRELLERYAALRHTRGYYETGRPGPWAGSAALPGGVRCLFLAGVAARLKGATLADAHRALAELADDLGLWRAVLTGRGDLPSKILAVAALRTDYLLLADVFADAALQLAPLDADLGGLLAPAPPGAWNISDGFASDFRAHAALLLTATGATRTGGEPTRPAWERLWNRVEDYFFLPQATTNLLAEQALQQMWLAGSAPSGLERGIQEFADWCDARLGTAHAAPSSSGFEWLWMRVRTGSIRALYNPIGQWTQTMQCQQRLRYVRWTYDAAALERGARLGYEIRRQQVAAGAVPEFMRQHREWSTHPIGEQPFVWSSANATIVVPTVDEPTGKRFWIRIWRAGDAVR